MYFKLTYVVTGYRVQPQLNAQIQIGGPRHLAVVLRNELNDPWSPGRRVILLECWAEFDPPRRAAGALRELAEGFVPEGAIPEEDLAVAIQDRRLPSEGRSLSFSELPGTLQEFSRQLSQELADANRAVFKLIRWRWAMEGPTQPFSTRGVEWSDDREIWHSFPGKFSATVSPVSSLRLNEEDIGEIETLMSSGIEEPIAQALFRQARSATFTSQRNYATALVMGMSALEIGVKQLIGALVPEAAWLADHSPSPPIMLILRDYLPTLPARQTIGGKVLPPPNKIMDTLKNATTARNETVHARGRDPDPDFVERVLDAVSDVLFMCDYYVGNEWAMEHISDDTRAALLEGGTQSDHK